MNRRGLSPDSFVALPKMVTTGLFIRFPEMETFGKDLTWTWKLESTSIRFSNPECCRFTIIATGEDGNDVRKRVHYPKQIVHRLRVTQMLLGEIRMMVDGCERLELRKQMH